MIDKAIHFHADQDEKATPTVPTYTIGRVQFGMIGALLTAPRPIRLTILGSIGSLNTFPYQSTVQCKADVGDQLFPHQSEQYTR